MPVNGQTGLVVPMPAAELSIRRSTASTASPFSRRPAVPASPSITAPTSVPGAQRPAEPGALIVTVLMSSVATYPEQS